VKQHQTKFTDWLRREGGKKNLVFDSKENFEQAIPKEKSIFDHVKDKIEAETFREPHSSVLEETSEKTAALEAELLDGFLKSYF